jgi:hypothetical protein
LVEPAIQYFTASRDILGGLSIMEPSNLDLRFGYLLREVNIGELLAESGHIEEALQRMGGISEALAGALETESHSNLRRYTSWVNYLLVWSDMSWRVGDRAGAAGRLDEAITHLRSLAQNGADRGVLAESVMRARFLAWQQRGSDLFADAPFQAFGAEQQAAGASCAANANRVRQAILNGDTETARDVTAKLLGSGYYEPGFIRTCRQYELCQAGE